MQWMRKLNSSVATPVFPLFQDSPLEERCQAYKLRSTLIKHHIYLHPKSRVWWKSLFFPPPRRIVYQRGLRFCVRPSVPGASVLCRQSTPHIYCCQRYSRSNQRMRIQSMRSIPDILLICGCKSVEAFFLHSIFPFCFPGKFQNFVKNKSLTPHAMNHGKPDVCRVVSHSVARDDCWYV